MKKTTAFLAVTAIAATSLFTGCISIITHKLKPQDTTTTTTVSSTSVKKPATSTTTTTTQSN